MEATLPVMARPRKHDETETTRISKEVMRQARTVANRRDISVPDLLHEILVPEIRRLYLDTVAEMAKEAAVERKRKPD